MMMVAVRGGSASQEYSQALLFLPIFAYGCQSRFEQVPIQVQFSAPI